MYGSKNLNVSMYVGKHAQIYICLCASKCIFRETCMHVYASMCACSRPAGMHESMHVYMHVCKHKYMNLYVYMDGCLQACMYVYMDG